MNSLFALAVVTLAACAIALPPAVLEGRPPDYLRPKYLKSQYVPTEDRTRIPYPPRPQPPPSTDWLNEEIDRINKMKQTGPYVVPFKPELSIWKNHEPYNRILFGSTRTQAPHRRLPSYFEYPSLPSKPLMTAGTVPRKHPEVLNPTLPIITENNNNVVKSKESEGETRGNTVFALTPTDEGYYEGNDKYTTHVPDTLEVPDENGGNQDLEEQNPRRQIRKNPFGRSKSLVTDDVAKLKEGLLKHKMRVPVSLIPANLDWLKITKDNQNNLNDSDAKDKPEHIRVLGSQFARGNAYTVGIALGVGLAMLLAILGIIYGWYVLSKRAKAAADVDYPAYGVTGPTVDTSGDRKLAHSAQMFHYQHQKQQIIAMERNNSEQRNGSVSDPESEEENEEGDYTVYECPGFATTGDMEVKNPLFTVEPNPATPGKTGEVKTQPKE